MSSPVEAQGMPTVWRTQLGRRLRSWPRQGALGFVSLLPAIVAIGLLLLAWELVATVGNMPSYILVPPTKVVSYIAANASFFLSQSWVTLEEILIGLALGCAVGIALAIGIVYSRLLSRALMPLIVGSQVVPKPAIAPLLVLWMGFGMEPKIVVAALIAFFPVVMNHSYGMNSVPKELLDLGRSLHANPVRLFFRIRFPYSLPALFSGIKIASSLAVIGAVVGEFVGGSSGLGYQITVAGFRIDTPLLLSSLVLLVLIGVVLYATVAVIERIAVPWARDD